MVARNFYEEDNNILYPRLDHAGDKTGITGSEFPLLNYLMYLFYELFGFSHWYGRLINLLVSSLGTWFFFLLVRQYYGRRTAFYAGLILLASLWFSFSRKSMPDTFSVALAITGLYFGMRYLKQNTILDLILFIWFASLGMLSKLPAFVVFSVLILSLLDGNIKLIRGLIIAIAGLVPLGLAVFWYYYWFPHLNQNYGFQFYFTGPEFPYGFLQLVRNPVETLDNFYFHALKFSGFAAFLAGLYFIFRKRENSLIQLFLIYSAFFFLYMIKAGYGFYSHGYYIIPYVPLMALIAGYGINCFRGEWIRLFIIGIIIVEGIANQQHDLFIKECEKYKMKLESIADSVSNRSNLVVINGGANPQLIYFTRRGGWTVEDSLLMQPGKVDSLQNRGADYLFVNRHSFDKDLAEYPLVYEDPDFRVYRLE